MIESMELKMRNLLRKQLLQKKIRAKANLRFQKKSISAKVITRIYTLIA